MNIELNNIQSEIIRKYQYSCLTDNYLYFNELTGYLKSGLPLPEILLNSYNQFNQYSQDLVNYDNIRYGTVGYSGNEEVLISQIYAAGGDENPIYRKDFIELMRRSE